MGEALKDSYGPEIPERVAAMLVAVDPMFPVVAFVTEVLDGFDDLELTPRARRIAEVLDRFLPEDFEDAAALITASLGPPIEGDELTGVGLAPFVYLPYVFWVAAHGVDHWDAAMSFQHELTQRLSCEYSIRAFIDADPERSLAQLRTWTRDPSPHVRRLVSEGTRPRLPWAPRLRRFIDDPSPVIELLDLLKDDPTTLVRRSVANNLNDIGRDHPDVLVEVCRRWLAGATAERVSLVKHALRSAVKRGDPGALDVLGYGQQPHLVVSDVSFEPPMVSIGGRIRISCTLQNTGTSSQAWIVDLRIHFVKANGATSPKVFKLKALEIEPGASVSLAKSISIAQHTTRTHHPGEHRAELVVNGVARPIGAFSIVAPSA